MKTICVLLAVMGLAVSAGATEYTKVEVSRKESNVYLFTAGTTRGVILTRYCGEFAIHDQALLKFDRYASDNKLMFSNGKSCDVEKVYTE